MNSWSEALHSPEQDWTPEEIVAKLEKYMKFLSSLKNYLFDDL
jgi:lambda repressor-like predicted transcriptional regulator